MAPAAICTFGDISDDAAGHFLDEFVIKVCPIQRGEVDDPANSAFGYGKTEGAAGIDVSCGVDGEVVIASCAGGAHAAIITRPDDKVASHGRKVFFPESALLCQEIEYPRKEVKIFLRLNGYLLVLAPPRAINGVKANGFHTQVSQVLRYLTSMFPILPADHADDHVFNPPFL